MRLISNRRNSPARTGYGHPQSSSFRAKTFPERPDKQIALEISAEFIRFDMYLWTNDFIEPRVSPWYFIDESRNN